MSLLGVDKERCQKDGLCAEVCPAGLIGPGADGWPVVEAGAEGFCIDCGHCVAVCPARALTHDRLPSAGLEPAARLRPDAAATVDGLLRGRRSVREYQAEPVSRDILAGLLDTARFAPTAKNVQEVGWIVVENPGLTRRLAATALTWLKESGLFPRYVDLAEQGRDVVLRGAPHVILAHAPADNPWGVIDCAIALDQLDLAAAARGLGGCWAGLLIRALADCPPLAGMLPLPEGRQVQAALMLGWPRFRYSSVPPRKALDAIWL